MRILYPLSCCGCQKAGATDEEIKSLAMISGFITINSTMLYADQFDIELLRKVISQ